MIELVPLCNGLDYMTGRVLAVLPAVLEAKSDLEKLHELRRLRAAVEAVLEAKISWTAPDSKKRAEGLIAEARGEAPMVVLQILSVFASYRAPLTHRKLREAIDGEIFRTRQLGLPGVA